MDQSLNHDKPGDFTGAFLSADTRRTAGICFLLASITFAVFGQTLHHDFVNYDDDTFVYDVPAVVNGITAEGVARAFTHGSLGFWDPLTTLSHMLDCELFGLDAGGHHLTNVLLHTVSVILLFLALRRLTGAVWRSAFVAALFAIHPLRVESVAWVSERKDTLSGVFFMLTLLAYAWYADGPPKLLRYLTVALCFVLGLMSKAMLVTLPLVLLLLDFWPLSRFGRPICKVDDSVPGGWWARLSAPTRVLLEKIPLLALSLAAGAVTVLTQNRVHSVMPLGTFPFGWRLANALISPIVYVRQMFYPAGLEVFYRFPTRCPPFWITIPAFVAMAAATVLAVHWRRKRPYLLVGWFWYLVMLAPVIGLLQSGAQAHADRYTYLPQIGLYVAMTWLAAELCEGRPVLSRLFGCAAALVVAALAEVAYLQTSCWKNSESLWTHAIACEPGNVLAHYNLGIALIDHGRYPEGVSEFQKALNFEPDYPNARNSLGYALFQQGKVDEAMTNYNVVLQAHPDNPLAHYDLGIALVQTGRLDEAITHFEKAVAVLPDDAKIRSNLGTAYQQKRRMNDAVVQYRQALEIDPNSAVIRKNVGRLAWVLVASPDDSLRSGPQAVELARELSQKTGGNEPVSLMILAAAYAETGRFADAIAKAQQAGKLATRESNFQLTGAIQAQLSYYQAGRPVRSAVQVDVP